MVSSAFAFRLFHLSKKKPDNELIRLFMFYFAVFSVFILATPFYLPEFFVTNPEVLKFAFLFAFVFLLFISNTVFNVFLLVANIKKEKTIIQIIWGILSIFVWVYLAVVIDPSAPVSGGLPWGFTPTSAGIVGGFFGLPFLLTSIAFYIKTFKAKTEQLKFFLLGTSFLLVIVGGPMHQFQMPYYLLADIITTLGFVSAFLALVIKDKN